MNEYRYYIKTIHKPASDVVVLELADASGAAVFDFKPGQYVMISYRNAKGGMEQKHPFSIASSPVQRTAIRLGIRIMGKFTTGLSQLPEGHEVSVSGPFGSFVFDEKQHCEAVFIAGGIGITPFVSSLAYATDKNLSNRMDLLYSSRTLDGAIFLREFREMEKRNGNMRTMVSVSEEKIDISTGNVISGRINAGAIKRFVGSVSGKTFFLCGPVGFMDAMRKNLADLGVRDSQIRTEEFSMIPDAGWWLRFRNMFYALGLSAAMFAMVFYVIHAYANKNVSSTAAGNASNNLNQTPPSAASNVGQQQAPAAATPHPSARTRVS